MSHFFLPAYLTGLVKYKYNLNHEYYFCAVQEKEDKLEGDAGLSKFFGEIYQNADEDTRRAMTKSFVRLIRTFFSIRLLWLNFGY